MIATQQQIDALYDECQAIEDVLKIKRDELSAAIKSKLTADGSQNTLTSFMGIEYIYDRPHKWNDPKKGVLSEDNIGRFSYLDFNGIVKGLELNRLYENDHFENEARYYTFIIPDECYEGDDGLPVPINECYEILSIKII